MAPSHSNTYLSCSNRWVNARHRHVDWQSKAISYQPETYIHVYIYFMTSWHLYNIIMYKRLCDKTYFQTTYCVSWVDWIRVVKWALVSDNFSRDQVWLFRSRPFRRGFARFSTISVCYDMLNEPKFSVGLMLYFTLSLVVYAANFNVLGVGVAVV